MFLFKHFFGVSSDPSEHMYGHSGFYRYNLKHLKQRYDEWVTAFPRIRPFYAMKTNPDKRIIKTLVDLGAGVDCASGYELSLARSCGASPQDIIFAQPCKTPHDIETNTDITLTTIDGESELLKLALLHPKCKMLIRIRADDPTARHPLGFKFGCEMMDVPYLLGLMRELNLQAVGVAFHVGSGSHDPTSYTRAIQNAKYIHDIFPEFGMTFETLDIGGGFCGKTSLDTKVTSTINGAIDMYFPPELGVSIVSEPGRYFTEMVGTLYAQVIGYKYTDTGMHYYIGDGVYGSFNPLLTRGDEYKITQFEVVRTPNNTFRNPDASDDERLRLSTVFGPTCDSVDCLMKDVMLPRLYIGDFLRFPLLGGYGVCGSSGFNGYNAASFPVYYDELT